jgi:AraC-like DNA-binding protein
MQLVPDILRFAVMGVLTLFIPLLLRSGSRRIQVYSAVLLCLCAMSYLLTDWPPLLNSAAFYVLLPLAVALPFVVWLSSRTLFDDHFRGGLWIGFAFPGYVGLQYGLFLNMHQLQNMTAGLVFQVLSLLLVALAIYEAARNREADLILSRMQFRSLFILLTALLVGLTLIAIMAFPIGKAPFWWDLTHKSIIALLVYFFAIRLLAFQPGFLAPAEATSVESRKPDIDTQLIAQLMHWIEVEKYYRTEGLTIRQLAEKMDVKEYKLRQAINQQLGFRNFNDFLNSYRIQEACALLADPEQKERTVLEVAYEMGYQSLAPFNRAFREQTGMTPTAWRKAKNADRF